jgi:hypothetical protein
VNEVPVVNQRVFEVESGTVMVVTDLHGDWAFYRGYRDLFLRRREQNKAHTLVIAGDFIHSEGPVEQDRSLDIVLDLMELQRVLGPALIVLLGNHEMPHIYHSPLAKGEHIYTPRFESVLGTHRQEVISFFDSLPIYVRTKAGVSICHAGAFAEVHDPAAMDQLRYFSHKSLLRYAEERLTDEIRQVLRQTVGDEMGISYAEVVRHYLAVESLEDSRYDDYLLGVVASQHPDFHVLWSALFSSNEMQYGRTAYANHVKGLLSALSEGYTTQCVLVTGHIGCRGGYSVLASNRQLRLASGVHAHPKTSARALVFDASVSVTNARALLPGLLQLQDLPG